MLEVSGLSISYGAVCALSDFSLCTLPGTITAVVGANGAGKSSLLRAISGLVPIKMGSIRVAGTDITRLAPSRRAALGISHAMEGRRLFRGMSVEDNLRLSWRFGRRQQSWPGALARIYDRFPVLAQKAAVPAGLLSGGQQQMLIMSGATMCDPALMLLDEPSLGLAPIIVQQIYDFLQEYRHSHGVTILLAEQMAVFALRVADQGCVLRRGRIVQQGDARGILSEGTSGKLAGAYL